MQITTRPNLVADAPTMEDEPPLYSSWMSRKEFEKMLSQSVALSKTERGVSSDYILKKYASEYYAPAV